MKKNSFNILRLTAPTKLATLVFVIALVLSGCGFAAKNLAKQVSDLTKQAAELQVKAADIEEKTAALSPRDRRTYQEELARLGFEPPEWLFSDAEALASGAPEETEEAPGGILGLIARIFGGGTASSGGASSGGGTFTLTGIPSQYNGKYAMVMAEDARETIAVTGVQALTMQEGGVSATFVPIRGGRATLNLWATTRAGVNPYTGNDTLIVAVAILNQAAMEPGDNPRREATVGFESVSFRNGNATQAWRDGTVEEAPPSRGGDASWKWTRVSDRSDIAIAYGGGRFVVGTINGYTAYSTDNGVTWTASVNRTFGSTTQHNMYDIAYGMNAEGNSRLVAVGYNGRMAYSADGVRWTAVANSTFRSDSFGYIYAIAYGGNRFVAGGSRGRMAYSADGGANAVGESWTAVADSGFGEDVSIGAIAYGGNRFVAGGDRGKMAYSADGITWTAVSNSRFGESSILDIAYGNNRWVAVGTEGKMAYSADGVRWTAVADTTFGSDDYIRAIAWGNNRWVAGGDDGKMAYSADGVRWTAVAESAFDRSGISAIAYANGRFVAVGRDGIAYADW